MHGYNLFFSPSFLPCLQNYSTVRISCSFLSTLNAQRWRGGPANYSTATQETIAHNEPKLLRIFNHTGKYLCSCWVKGRMIQNGTSRMNHRFEEVHREKIRKKNSVPIASLVGSSLSFLLFCIFWSWQHAYVTFIIGEKKIKTLNTVKHFPIPDSVTLLPKLLTPCAR